MRTLLLLLVSSLSLFGSGLAEETGAETVRIKLLMHSPELSEGSRVFVAGNVKPLGNWRPNVAEMKPTDEHTWSLQVSVPKGTALEYKYTLGDWGREGAGEDGRPLPSS